MDAVVATLYLKRGRDKPVRRRHPWIFSGAIARVDGRPDAGDLVDVAAAEGDWLGRAYYNPHSQIRGRILTWDPEELVDEAFWHRRLSRAITARDALVTPPQSDAYRLCYAEADGLPGLVVDRYGDFLVLQSLTAGIERRKTLLVDLLRRLLRPAGIVERSDTAARRKEGLPRLRQVIWGQAPPAEHLVTQTGYRCLVDLMAGHKTGLYLDQAVNRTLVCRPETCAGRSVLNVFSYTGGFALPAAAAGAVQILNLDSSVPALELAERNVALNTPGRVQDEYLAGDAFQVLRDFREQGRQFDLIILDPPKFAHQRGDVDRACRGYKDLNWLACQLLPAGGLLATFSCSGLVEAALFQKVIFGAGLDAGRELHILQTFTQSPDHPILLTFPESAYLKGLLCRVW